MTLRPPLSWTKSRLSRYYAQVLDGWCRHLNNESLAGWGVREEMGKLPDYGFHRDSRRKHTFFSSGWAGAILSNQLNVTL